MINYIVKMFKSLNANANPGEIAHSFSIALLLGLMPKNNLLWYLLFIFFMFVRINKGFYFLLTFVFSLLAGYTDSLLNQIGYTVLTLPALENIFATLIDIPFVGFTKFNNTIVMGSLVLGLILYIPMYIIGRLFVKLWRNTIAPFIRKLSLFKAFYKLPFVEKIKEIAEGV